MLQLTKDQTSARVRSQVSSDLSQLRTRIQSIYLNPANCNANFVNRVANGSNITIAAPDGIRVCNTSAVIECKNFMNYTVVVPVHTATWESEYTKLSGRMRVKSIQYNLKQGVSTYRTISEASVSIEVETLSDIAKKDPITGLSKSKINLEKLNIAVPVIVQGTTVVGCPKSWNSTIPYGSTI